MSGSELYAFIGTAPDGYGKTRPAIIAGGCGGESAEPPWPLAIASSQSLRVQVGAGYRNQGFDRASSLGSCLLAQGMTCLTHRAAPQR